MVTKEKSEKKMQKRFFSQQWDRCCTTINYLKSSYSKNLMNISMSAKNSQNILENKAPIILKSINSL